MSESGDRRDFDVDSIHADRRFHHGIRSGDGAGFDGPEGDPNANAKIDILVAQAVGLTISGVAPFDSVSHSDADLRYDGKALYPTRQTEGSGAWSPWVIGPHAIRALQMTGRHWLSRTTTGGGYEAWIGPPIAFEWPEEPEDFPRGFGRVITHAVCLSILEWDRQQRERKP